MAQQPPRVSLDTLAAMMAEQGRKLDTMQAEWAAFRNAMPDSYVPRREVEANFKDVRERGGNHETRLVAMEEWRLAETQRAAMAQSTLQAQIQTTASAGAREAQGVEQRATARQDVISRMTQEWLFRALLAISVALLTYILTHH